VTSGQAGAEIEPAAETMAAVERPLLEYFASRLDGAQHRGAGRRYGPRSVALGVPS
jgi:hypothetical protein